MGYYSARLLNFISLFLIAIIAILLLLLFCPIVFLSLPESSSTFDCDDGTLAMYRHFESLGISSIPFVGNLDMDGEAYLESDHVWLMVKFGDNYIAYDWGLPQFDRQHYEGYPISLEYLLHAIKEDMVGKDMFPLSPDESGATSK